MQHRQARLQQPARAGYWWIDGYVDLDARQSPRVRAELNTLLAWHRREELPRLAGLLQQARAQTSGDVSPEQACRLAEDIRQRVLATLERIELPAAELAVSLDESQLYALELKYDKINAAYRQDWLDLDPAKQRDKRFKLYLERYEDFYGRLDSAQRQLLRNMADRSSLDPATIDADRRHRQAEAIEILKRASREKPATSAVRQQIRAFLLQSADPPPGLLRDRQQALLQEGCRNLAEIHNRTTSEQRERAVRRLRSYETDLRDLAESH